MIGYELNEKFISKYDFYPVTEKDFVALKFINCMQKFIADNSDNREIKFACMVFPELSEVPHPDEIPEEWGLLPWAREVLKNAYIEKIDKEIEELRKELTFLKEENKKLQNENSKLKVKAIEPCEKMVQTSDFADNKKNIPAAIHRKFFIPPTPKNRYQLLTNGERDWIRVNAGLSDVQMEIFDLCCSCNSLKEVAEKSKITHTRIKHISAAIIKYIQTALEIEKKYFNNEAVDG